MFGNLMTSSPNVEKTKVKDDEDCEDDEDYPSALDEWRQDMISTLYEADEKKKKEKERIERERQEIERKGKPNKQIIFCKTFIKKSM
jgi:hypothetical protein